MRARVIVVVVGWIAVRRGTVRDDEAAFRQCASAFTAFELDFRRRRRQLAAGRAWGGGVVHGDERVGDFGVRGRFLALCVALRCCLTVRFAVVVVVVAIVFFVPPGDVFHVWSAIHAQSVHDVPGVHPAAVDFVLLELGLGGGTAHLDVHAELFDEA
jgi:hypothetical protein